MGEMRISLRNARAPFIFERHFELREITRENAYWRNYLVDRISILMTINRSFLCEITKSISFDAIIRLKTLIWLKSFCYLVLFAILTLT